MEFMIGSISNEFFFDIFDVKMDLNGRYEIFNKLFQFSMKKICFRFFFNTIQYGIYWSVSVIQYI